MLHYVHQLVVNFVCLTFGAEHAVQSCGFFPQRGYISQGAALFTCEDVHNKVSGSSELLFYLHDDGCTV